jgi:hypothetical protein
VTVRLKITSYRIWLYSFVAYLYQSVHTASYCLESQPYLSSSYMIGWFCISSKSACDLPNFHQQVNQQQQVSVMLEVEVFFIHEYVQGTSMSSIWWIERRVYLRKLYYIYTNWIEWCVEEESYQWIWCKHHTKNLYNMK